MSKKYNNPRLGKIWYDIINRCYNENCFAFKNYGARGIKVCEEWHTSYKSFEKWALQSGYNDNLTIDRIDVNKNYQPSNCRWVTKSQQCNNRTNNIFISFNGETVTIAQWAKKLKISIPRLHYRYTRHKEDLSRVIYIGNGRKKFSRRGKRN